MTPPPPIPLAVPSSWYCVGFAEDVWRGVLLTRRLAGQDLVLFRGEDGAVAALDAWCPHLGAHLGVGGTVCDGEVRCPFHGFRFGADGVCRSTPYGGKVPPSARIRTWPVREVNGLLMVWYGAAGEPPTFEIPALDRAGWTAWRHHRFPLRGHPQEVAENSVDTGHLVAVHGYRALRTLAPLETDGPCLVARYGFERPRPLLGRGVIAAEIEIRQYGLGYAIVEVDTLSLGVRTRQLVLSQPVEQDRLDLRIGMAVREVAEPGRIHPLLAWFPFRRWLTERIADQAIEEYVGDVSQDCDLWETKRFLPRPALAEGDGPVGRYRAWASRFYPQEAKEVRLHEVLGLARRE